MGDAGGLSLAPGSLLPCQREPRRVRNFTVLMYTTTSSYTQMSEEEAQEQAGPGGNVHAAYAALTPGDA